MPHKIIKRLLVITKGPLCTYLFPVVAVQPVTPVVAGSNGAVEEGALAAPDLMRKY